MRTRPLSPSPATTLPAHVNWGQRAAPTESTSLNLAIEALHARQKSMQLQHAGRQGAESSTGGPPAYVPSLPPRPPMRGAAQGGTALRAARRRAALDRFGVADELEARLQHRVERRRVGNDVIMLETTEHHARRDVNLLGEGAYRLG
jgi:hypothetical protein